MELFLKTKGEEEEIGTSTWHKTYDQFEGK
jgi:hypothetical protein